jgi:hypothetical protein
VVPAAILAKQRLSEKSGAAFAKAARCYRLYGDIVLNCAEQKTL